MTTTVRFYKSYRLSLWSSILFLFICITGFVWFSGRLSAKEPEFQKLRPNDHVDRVSDASSSRGEVFALRARIAELEARMAEAERPESGGSKRFPRTNHLPASQRKRILVTGGAGFVGSHLVDRLMMQGHEVTAADNFFTGRKRNVEHWLGHERFDLIRHDIVNPLMIEVDEIYHLASPASPPHYMLNPVKTIKTNTLGTINMMGLAKRVGAKVLVASTSEVYGDPDVHPQSEEYWGRVNPIGPRSCYDEGKRVAESLTYAYAKQEHVDVRVARIFNTYGPRMHINDGRVVSNFISRTLQKKTLQVYGSGKQTRSFQFITDLVDGLVRLMESNVTSPVNLGNPEEYSVEELRSVIADLIAGNWEEAVYLPQVEDDPQRRKPDITKARSLLGWEPKVRLRQGLQRTVKYFEQELLHHEAKESTGGSGGDAPRASLSDRYFIMTLEMHALQRL